MSTVMRQSPPSIVTYCYQPKPLGQKCGLCKSPVGSHDYGMWAHSISPESYEHLVNTGWSRSGCYLYKPMSEINCCPKYPIRNLISHVKISKSQRKVMTKFRKYLTDRVKKNDSSHNNVPRNSNNKINTTGNMESSRQLPTAPVQDIDPHQTHSLKKKHLRRQRTRQKLLSKGLDPDEFFKVKNEHSALQGLQDFFNGLANDDKLGFSTKLIKMNSSGDFNQTYFEMEHALFKKYQMAVHGDNEDECSANQYKRVLCASPFYTGGDWDDDDDDDSDLSEGDLETIDTSSKVPLLGTYHQHYYIGSTLFAVGVMDILPTSVYSFSFFYDMDYSFLNPGTLGALQEIHLVAQLAKVNPQMESYHLGFYVHSCGKMRYKSKYRPCQLLCLSSREWVEFDERVTTLLDSVNEGFVILKDDVEGVNDNRTNLKEKDDDDDSLLKKVRILHDGAIYNYKDYPVASGSDSTTDFPDVEKDRKEKYLRALKSFAKVVGSVVAPNMLVHISMGNE